MVSRSYSVFFIWEEKNKVQICIQTVSVFCGLAVPSSIWADTWSYKGSRHTIRFFFKGRNFSFQGWKLPRSKSRPNVMRGSASLFLSTQTYNGHSHIQFPVTWRLVFNCLIRFLHPWVWEFLPVQKRRKNSRFGQNWIQPHIGIEFFLRRVTLPAHVYFACPTLPHCPFFRTGKAAISSRPQLKVTMN